MSYSRISSQEVHAPWPFSCAALLLTLRYRHASALERWGLGPDKLRATNPGFIFTRVSGYGQTGPWSSRPGYASVCEGEAGFRFINGFPDERTGELSGPPVRPNISLGDSVAGLTASFETALAPLVRRAKEDRGITEALWKGKEKKKVHLISPCNEVVENENSMLNLMEGIIPEFDRKGVVRSPSGSSVTGIVPTGAYPCSPAPGTAPDSPPNYVTIGANADSMYERLMRTIGRADLTGAAFAKNHHRVARYVEIEDRDGGLDERAHVRRRAACARPDWGACRARRECARHRHERAGTGAWRGGVRLGSWTGT